MACKRLRYFACVGLMSRNQRQIKSLALQHHFESDIWGLRVCRRRTPAFPDRE